MDDLYAINAVKSEIREGFNSSDAERVLRCYAAEFSDWSFGLPAIGRGESKTVLRVRLQQLFSHNAVQLIPTIVGVYVTGNTAVARGWHQLTLTAHSDGTTRTLRTRYLELWRKDPSDGWQILVAIDNPDGQPMMPDTLLHKLEAGHFDEVTRTLK